MDTKAENDRVSWLQGPNVKCSHPPDALDRPWRLVLLGAPGVGKGTQAELLCKKLGACHLSTGDVFRAASSPCNRNRTPAMVQALNYMKKGALVPDTTVCEIVRERAGCIACRGGFILDGFPRTLLQVGDFQALLHDEGLSLDAVVNYQLPIGEIVARLSGRRVCEKCKAVFHVTHHKPKQEGVCDHCGGKLIQREDDRAEAVRTRMETYERETSPLIDHYRRAGLLVTIEARGTPEEIFHRTVLSLEAAITDGALRTRNPHDAMVGLNAHGEGRVGPKEPL